MNIKLIAVIMVLGILTALTIVNSQEKSMSKKCSEIVDGLQLCTTTPKIAVQAGDDIVVKLLLRNTTKEPLSVGVGDLEVLYEIKVADSKGRVVSSFRESLRKKVANGELSNDNLVEALPINSGPRTVTVQPEDDLPIELNLSQFYDFSRVDTYLVTISRKLKEKSGEGSLLSFGSVTVDVK